jgi:multiple sugar transport system ATP-binding protein
VASIRIERLTKSYGASAVLKDLSLDIADGEFVVLVGPSGCGKTTTLKLLAGLDTATSGRIFIGDRDVTDLAPGDRDVAMVFQNYALYPHLSVRSNMAFGLRMRGTPRAEREKRVRAAAAMLGIEHLLDRRPRALSGGQRQRVALGRAIVREPRAFLMDEPLSNLDAALRARTRAEISALHDRLKVTTLYVTHDQTEAMTMADRIVVMKDGEVQQVAPPAEMFARPANLFVAGFIGSPAMNFLRAVVHVCRGAAHVDLFGQHLRVPVKGRLPERLSQPVIVGIRPEHLCEADEGYTFTIHPVRVENLGSEQIIHGAIPREHRTELPLPAAPADHQRGTFIVRLLNARPIEVGRPLPVAFDPAHLHFFDPATEKSLAGQT